VEVLAMKGDFLFLDIDGCLSRGKYAPFDVAALQALAALAQNAETEVVLCTGRSLSYVEAIAQFVRFGRYAGTDPLPPRCGGRLLAGRWTLLPYRALYFGLTYPYLGNYRGWEHWQGYYQAR